MPGKIDKTRQRLKRRFGMKYYQENKQAISFFVNIPLGCYIPDFYCRELKLIIEIDGDSHSVQEGYDIARTYYFETKGLSIFRFTNRDVLSNIDAIKEYLHTEISKTTPSIPL